MNNLEYIRQKIKWYGESESAEYHYELQNANIFLENSYQEIILMKNRKNK